MWVRGLKLPSLTKCLIVFKVAPYVGAWIETSVLSSALISALSHPMWVRGLKL